MILGSKYCDSKDRALDHILVCTVGSGLFFGRTRSELIGYLLYCVSVLCSECANGDIFIWYGIGVYVMLPD